MTVDTAKVAAVFSNRGARILSWRLKHYDDDHGRPVDLVPAGLARVRLGRLPCGRKSRGHGPAERGVVHGDATAEPPRRIDPGDDSAQI